MPLVTRQEPTPSGAVTESVRDAFLSGTLSPEVLVPEAIRMSWERSSKAGLDPAALAPVHHETDTDPRVLAAVDAVFAQQLTFFASEPISIIFASPTGTVLRQVCPDRGLTGALQSVCLEPGADYGEAAVGTNGIGTALHAEVPTLIVGSEHFVEELTVFACAGAPVFHPVSRSLLGIVDLTCNAARGNALLLSHARQVAAQIELELLSTVGARQMALLRDYLAACRHATGPIVASNSDVVMMNHLAQQSLTPTDRAALLARTSDARAEEKPTTLVADLPSGTVAKMEYRPTFLGSELVGGIFRVGLRASAASTARPAAKVPRLAGLAGSSTVWTRTIAALRVAGQARRWVVLDGEGGVGKFALARAMHYAENPDRHFRMLDCDTAAEDPDGWLHAVEEEFAGAPGTLVLRHIHALPQALIGPLSELLLEQSAHSRVEDGHWVVATRDESDDQPAVTTQLIPIFDVSITVPPLRHRGEDVRTIANLMLAQLSRGDEITLSPRALNQLQRHPWPGNATQLQQVLRKVLLAKRRGVVEVADLPSECHGVGRRMLTPLEALERDAIVLALQSHDGNKRLAAIELGMSRATIYRKIRDYSITTDNC